MHLLYGLNPMFNVHFTAVTNYIQNIKQNQPEVPSEQTNEGQSEYGPQKKSHVCESSPMEIQNRLQQFLRKSDPNPTQLTQNLKKPTQPNPTQPMDGPGPRPTLVQSTFRTRLTNWLINQSRLKTVMN